MSKAIDKAAGKQRAVVGHHDYTTPDIRGNAYESDRAKERERLPSAITAPATDSARQWEGWGTALKPAWEPIILARKPLEGTVAQNIVKWGTGTINVDGCRVDGPAWNRPTTQDIRGGGYGTSQGKNNIAPRSNSKGRWPANVIHDGSEEVLELFPETKPRGTRKSKISIDNGIFGNGYIRPQTDNYAFDSGSAARFFYCAKASRAEREMGCEGTGNKPNTFANGTRRRCPEHDAGVLHGANTYSCGCPILYNEPRTETSSRNHHPTVKPLALMRYLCRLVTPPNGVILDPFMGSGTTGMAAKIEGFRFIGIEKEKEYCEIAERRIEAVLENRYAH